MKRLFSALALSMLLALSGSQMCYAAEGQNVVTEFPQEISVEGGILKFVVLVRKWVGNPFKSILLPS